MRYIDEIDNIELQPPAQVFREVYLALQNSSNIPFYLTFSQLTAGQWDPTAPSGVPTQGYTVNQGAMPTWGNLTPTPFTSVGGSMQFNVGAAQLKLAWNWQYGSSAVAYLSLPGSPLTASITTTNVNTSPVTVTVTVTGNAS